MALDRSLEGPLSKWTNVVQGWQYRWFVLDRDSGLLSYYTSKEKMMKGSRRGCLRLRGAVVGIDDEDDSTFTISCDHKTFHFQARDEQERDTWISSLENTITHHAQPFKRIGSGARSPEEVSQQDIERKLMEATGYHKLLIGQVEKMQARIEGLSAQVGDRTKSFRETSQGMVDTMKECIDLMAYAKSNHEKGIQQSIIRKAQVAMDLKPPEVESDIPKLLVSAPDQLQSKDEGSISPLVTRPSYEEGEPAASYSSEEDQFYDASEFTEKDDHEPNEIDVSGDEEKDTNQQQETRFRTASQEDVKEDVSDSDDDDVSADRSVISYLLSQVRIGMDLTRITLPTFILEKRSLLEMYADFFAHPDIFSSVADVASPKDRILSVAKWYLSAFHAGRKASIAKKPFNPILGEMFQCFWDLGSIGGQDATDVQEIVSTGPVPWAGDHALAFVAEQVSHHPPVSAFYVENVRKRIQVNAHIYTKSKFLGLAIGVHNIGQACISVLDLDEDYVITFPNGYGRSILTVPWMELGGKVSIVCKKTGYTAAIEFHCKPFYGGKKHRISGEISHSSSKKPIMKLDGEWNSVMSAKNEKGESEVFIDTRIIPIWKKRVRATHVQADNESRKLWKDLTINLKTKKIEAATSSKHKLEEKQRAEAKARKAAGEEWQQKLFHQEDGLWVFNNPLRNRLNRKD